MLGMDVRFLSDAVQQRSDANSLAEPKNHSSDAESQFRAEVVVSQMNPIECEVARILLIDDERLKDFSALNYFDLFTEPALRTLINDYAKIDDHQNAWAVEQALSPAEHKLFECLVCRESDVSEQDLEQWFNGALASLTRNWAESERRKLSLEIQEAIRQGNQEKIAELVKRNAALVATLKESSNARKYMWELHRN